MAPLHAANAAFPGDHALSIFATHHQNTYSSDRLGTLLIEAKADVSHIA